MASKIQSSLQKHISDYAQRKLRPVTVHSLKTFGEQEPLARRLKTSAEYLKSELPARYAHMIKAAESTPMTDHIQMQGVLNIWARTFQDLLDHKPIKNEDDVETFSNLTREIIGREAGDAELIRSALIETRKSAKDVWISSGIDTKIDHILDRIFGNRIGSRLLQKQHVAMTEIISNRFVGLLDLQCNPAELARMAGEDVRSICEMTLGVAPRVIVEGHLDLTFPYFTTHVHYIISELIKNSARATVEHHGAHKSEKDLPPIVVTVAKGKEDVTLRVSGRGGGITRSRMKNIWRYSSTSAEEPNGLAGYGFGLPLSRLYARYFGGDLRILSLDGWGTDAYLTLLRLSNQPEIVADFNPTDLNSKLKSFIARNEGTQGIDPLQPNH